MDKAEVEVKLQISSESTDQILRMASLLSEFLVFVSVREIFGFSEKLLGLGRWCCSTSIHPRDRPASSAEMNFMQCHFTA